jgi:hypothetical protein
MVDAPTALPHMLQNFEPGGKLAPHCEHVTLASSRIAGLGSSSTGSGSSTSGSAGGSSGSASDTGSSGTRANISGSTGCAAITEADSFTGCPQAMQKFTSPGRSAPQ